MGPSSPSRPAGDEVVERVPWHFWILVVALVIYLGWRLLQGIAWVADKV